MNRVLQKLCFTFFECILEPVLYYFYFDKEVKLVLQLLVQYLIAQISVHLLK